MRLAGFTLAVLLAATPTALAQVVPGVAPGAPAAGQPPAAAPAADPKLDPHLNAWEKRMGDITNFAADIKLTRKEAVFQKARDYTGKVLCMKPNLARLQIVSTAKPKPGDPVDYESFICSGSAIYEYSGLRQDVTKYELGPNAAADNNLMIDFLSGMKANDAKRRFQISLFNEDQFYVYLDIKPVLQKDQQEFTHVRFALFGPKTQFAYLPAQVWLQKPNGDTEMWQFANPQTNVPNVDKSVFEYVPVKDKATGKEWPLKKFQPPAPPGGGGQPPKLPGGTNLPAGPGMIKKP